MKFPGSAPEAVLQQQPLMPPLSSDNEEHSYLKECPPHAADLGAQSQPSLSQGKTHVAVGITPGELHKF